MTDTQRIDWLEKQADEGRSPALVNDDNGHWAVSMSGFQNAVCGDGPQDIETTFFVNANQWKNTVREAIDAAIKQEAP